MDKVQLILLVAALISFLSSFILAYLNTARIEGLYNSDNGELDRKYFQHASPKGVAFGIVWPIIYLWNLAAIVYLLVSCFLPVHKSPVLVEPTLVPKSFLVTMSVLYLSTVGWLFSFDREILGLALAMLIIGVAAAYATIAVSYKTVWDNAEKLQEESKNVVILMRILVHNGLCVIATWLTVATLLNLADVIIYQDSPGVDVAVQRGTISVANGSTVVLAILLVLIIAWFVLENFVWEKYCRWTFTIYPVLILALSALIAKLRPLDDARQNLIFASVNLGIVLVAFIARIALSVFRAHSRKKNQVA